MFRFLGAAEVVELATITRMVKMFVTHFSITVVFAHHILLLVTSIGRLVSKADNVRYTDTHTFCWLHNMLFNINMAGVKGKIYPGVVCETVLREN